MYKMNYRTGIVNFLGEGAYFENLTFGGAVIRSFTVTKNKNTYGEKNIYSKHKAKIQSELEIEIDIEVL